jgi:hypothetical protein
VYQNQRKTSRFLGFSAQIFGQIRPERRSIGGSQSDKYRTKRRQDESTWYLKRAHHVGPRQAQNNDGASDHSELRQYTHATEFR